jgi:hypothetical protein
MSDGPLMQIGVSISHHDHDYVERRGGHVFFSHLRGAPARARYREAALRRAEALHAQAWATGATPEETCGAGLITLQRAVFAAEDLAVLLHALAEDDPEAAADPASGAGREIWPRLVAVTIRDQNAVFAGIVRDPAQALRAFRLPPDEVLARESLAPAAEAAARPLRDRTGRRWAGMLLRLAGFWLTYGNIAKATMHGFAAIAGRQVTEPPGAGFLASNVRAPAGPFVLMVNSHLRGTDVRTPSTPLEMTPERVRDFRRSGSVAVKLAAELCETLAEGIELGYAYGIPNLLADRLNAADQAALADAQRAAADAEVADVGGPYPEAAP